MKRTLILALAVSCSIQFAGAQKKPAIVNPAIDMQGYLKAASDAAQQRESSVLGAPASL